MMERTLTASQPAGSRPDAPYLLAARRLAAGWRHCLLAQTQTLRAHATGYLLLLLGSLLAPYAALAQTPPPFCRPAVPGPTPVLRFTTAFQTTAPAGTGTTLYWRFTAVAGEKYSFSTCNSPGVNGGAYLDLRVLNQAGTPVASANYLSVKTYCPSTNNTSLDWTCPAGAGGTYWLHTSYFDCRFGLFYDMALSYKSTLTSPTLPPPTLGDPAPASGDFGTLVTVPGTNLQDVFAVNFGGWSATEFSVNAGGTLLSARVPVGARTGLISATTLDGAASSSSPFTVTAPTVPNLKRAEYFVDADPGPGRGTALSGVGGSPQAAGLTAVVPIGGLSVGYHTIGTRGQDQNLVWGLSSTRAFFVDGVAAMPTMRRAEWFLDADPGVGQAAAIPLPNASSTDVAGLSFAVALSGLPPGFHSLFVRTQDANKVWSMSHRRLFFLESTPPALVNIEKLEYFIDTDPGLNRATAVTLPGGPVTDAAAVALPIDISALASGFHSIGIRSRDANKVWSLTTRRSFIVESVVANLRDAEYFIDTDPGLGRATAVPLPAGTPDANGLSVVLPVSGLSDGFHTFGFRSRDVNRVWSLTHRQRFLYQAAPAAPTNITKAEYYFDNADPGLNRATPITVSSPAPDIAGLSAAVGLSTLSDGPHTLAVRSRDENKVWSLTHRLPFAKNGCMASPNYAAPALAGLVTATGNYQYEPDLIFSSPTAPANPFQFYSAAIVTENLVTPRTLNEVRYTLRNVAGNPILNITVQVQTSTDGNTWTTRDTYSPVLAAGAAGLAPAVRQFAAATNVRFLRLVMSESPANYFVEVFGGGAFNVPACDTQPTITSFTPTSGAAGTSVDIVGTNLEGATSVRFNGTAQTVISNSTGTGLTVAAPAGGTTGQLSVSTPQGVAYSVASYVYPPTITTTVATPSSLCTSTFLQVNFATNTAAFGTGNQFRFQLSDASGVFDNNSRLYGGNNQTVSSTGGILRDTVAFRTPTGSGYRVRVVGSNPVAYGTDNASNLTIFAPPLATASVNTPVAANGSTVTFDATPASGMQGYRWLFRDQFGSVSTVSFSRSFSRSNVTPRNDGGFYWVQITSLNGCVDTASVKLKVLNPSEPSVNIALNSSSRCAGGSLNMGFSVTGNTFNSGNTLTAQLSDNAGSFASPVALSAFSYSGQGSGNFSFTVPANTAPGSGYRVRLVGSSPIVSSNVLALNVTGAAVAVASSNSPVAFGGTVQLTAQAVAGATYQWSGPNFSSTQQNPTFAAALVGTNTYTLTVSSGGCVVQGTTSVTVQPSPQPVLTLTPVNITGTICGGTNLFFTFRVTGNTFNSGNIITAQLSDASGSFASPTAIGNVSFAGSSSSAVSIATVVPLNVPAGSGYRVRLIGSDPSGVLSNDNGFNIILSPRPTAVASSNSPVPYGGTVQLSTPTISGAGYQWSGPNGFSSTLQNPTISNATQTANQGNYSLVVVSNFCASPAAVINVQVSPSTDPILSMSQFGGTICGNTGLNVGFNVTGNSFSAGNIITAQLSDATGSFGSPTAIGNVGFSGQGNGFVPLVIPSNVEASGLYRIRLVGSNPFGVVSISTNGSNLLLKPAPAATASSNSPVASGGSIRLSAALVAGATYQWTGPAGFSTTVREPEIQNATTANGGVYTLVATLNGCQRLSQTSVEVGAAATTLTVASFGGSFCPGASFNVPFTASGFGGGNVFTAQLSDNNGQFTNPISIGTLAGTGSGQIAATLPNSVPTGTNYRIRVVASAPAQVSGTDNGQNLSIGALTFAWTGGNNSTNWFDPLNWSCGQVPNATSVVTISGGLSYYPVVSGNPAAVLNLFILNGASLTINSTFNLHGNVTVNGTMFAGGGSSWYFAGAGLQYIYGANPLQVGNLFINSGSTLVMSNALNVSGNWTNNGLFTGSVLYDVRFNGGGAVQLIAGTVSTSFFDVFVNAGALVNLGISTIFLHDFIVDGTFSAAVYNIVLNGTTAQILGGGGSSTYYGITINNLTGVTLGADIRVLGNWINNGLFIGGIYSVTFAGTLAQLIGGTVVTNFYDLVLQNPVSVTLNQHIYVLGGFENTGVFYGYQLVGGVTTGYFVRFGGTLAQVINANATTYFYHFYVDNLAGVSLSTNIFVAGNYYLFGGFFAPGTFTVNFNGTNGYVQTIGGYAGLSFYGWNVGSGATVRLLQNVTLLGGFVNAGTFYGYNLVGGVYTGYTFTFGGTVAQIVSGGGRYEFGNVLISNVVTGGVTFNAPVYVLGNWRNNGVFFAGTGTVYFNGTVAQLIGGTVTTRFHHVSIGNLLSVSLNQAITVTGNWLGTGVFFGTGYLVYFDGPAAQTILTGIATRFGDVRFGNVAGVTLLSNIYLNGNWTNDGGFVANGFRVLFSGTALQVIAGSVLTQFHHISFLSGSVVRLDRAITVLGNWTHDALFNPNGLTVTFAGTANQLIGGTVVTPFFGVFISNTVGVTLAQNIRVRGGWTNNGLFIPAAFTVFFDGLVAQLIGGTAVSTFFNLNIGNTVGVSLSGPIFIRGNLVNDGLFTCDNFLVTFNGIASQLIGGTSETVFGNVTFNNAVGISLGQNVRVHGDLRNLALFTAGGYRVRFDGSLAQGIYCPTGTLTLHDVVFANLAGVTLFDDLFITGNWLNDGGFVANGQLVSFTGTTLQTIGGTVASVFYDFAIEVGASVRQLLGLTVRGDWTNAGIFQHNNLLVVFDGTLLQTISGPALSVFYDLTLNNAVNVSLAADIDVTHDFVNLGGFCGCGHRTRFNGTAPQTITCTSGRTHFHDLTFANTAGVTLLDGIYVSGNWVNLGGYVANQQLVIFDGTALQTISGPALTAFYNLGITNAVDVRLLTDITVAGAWNNTGRFDGNGYDVTFNGTVAQVVTTTGANARTHFHHVVWANLLGCRLAGDVYVAGDWRCNAPLNPDTWTVHFDGTVAQTCGGSVQLNFYGLNVSNPLGVSFGGPAYLRGDFVNTGLVNVGLHGWYFVGSTAQSIGGVSLTPTRFYDLFVQNTTGVGLTHNIFLTHLLRLDAGNLASDDHLTLVSNATGTAMVVNPAGGGEVTGRATMERFITGAGAMGYRHYASPMRRSAASISTTVQQFADDLPVFEINPAYNTVGNAALPFPTFYAYDQSRLGPGANNFNRGYLVPAADEDLSPLRGYAAMTDPTTTVDIAGRLQNGPVSLSVSRGTETLSGWQLLGNPYPAPLDWDVVRGTPGMLDNVADALYVFAPSGRYQGAYSAYVAGLGQNGGTKDVAAMQGFFVRATAAAGSVSLTNAVRATAYRSPGFRRDETDEARRPVLRLLARHAATGLADETVIYFQAGAGLDFEARHDAYKVATNPGLRPTLSSRTSEAAGAAQLAINGLPDLAAAPLIPLGVQVGQSGAHRLVLGSQLNVPAGTQVWLEDRLLNRRQNLAQDSSYAFEMATDFRGPRFFLNFRPGTLTAVTTGALAGRTALYPNPTTGRATLELTGLREQGPVRIDLVDVLGRVVQQRSARPRQGILSENLDLRDLPTGVYMVRVHAQEGTVVKRLVRD